MQQLVMKSFKVRGQKMAAYIEFLYYMVHYWSKKDMSFLDVSLFVDVTFWDTS